MTALANTSLREEPAKAAYRPRHSWSDPYREFYATKRHCWNCGLMKITRHEPGILPWVEYWHDGVRIRMDEECRRVPPCAMGDQR